MLALHRFCCSINMAQVEPLMLSVVSTLPGCLIAEISRWRRVSSAFEKVFSIERNSVNVILDHLIF